jgi:mono/diheme cytochrome c family protein
VQVIWLKKGSALMKAFAANGNESSRRLRPSLRRAFAFVGLAALTALITVSLPARPAKPDTNESRVAFLQVYRVLTSPRCQNCHPAGDAPLQGDDSHVHQQNVKRGADGHGVYGMRCDTCHQAKNLPGEHMPPGNPKWSLPSPEQKMVFVGRSPAELCKQLKDPQQNGGRALAALLDHVANDDLVGWAWNPGDGRTLPPLSRVETAAHMKVWVEGGAACPE